jgi:hypothetical protein
MMSTASPQVNSVKKHQREVFWKIIVPVVLPAVALVGLCVALGIGFGVGTVEDGQISVVMSILATFFIALPLAILCLIPYVLLVVVVYFSGRAYARARTPLRAAHRLSGQVAVKTSEYAPKFAQPLIALNTRVTRWEHTLRSWQQPALPAEKESSHEQ